MDFQTIAFLTLAVIVILGIFLVAGLVLSARAFTQLVELTQRIGYLVVQQHQDTQHLVTTSLQETAHNIESVLKENGHTTPEHRS